MAPIGLNLGQNAFQVIPVISFFDVENRKNSVVSVFRPGQDTRVLGQENPLRKNKYFRKIPYRESPTYVGDSLKILYTYEGPGPITYT